MRFADYAKECHLHRAAQERLQKAAERSWVVPRPMDTDERGPILIGVRVLTYAEDFTDAMNGVDITIHLNVSRWRKDGSATCKLPNGREVSGGFFDYLHSPLQYLDADEIESVAYARKVVQKWIDGELETLPQELF